MENDRNVYNPVNEYFKNPEISHLDEYKALYQESMDDNEAFWEHQAKKVLRWQHDFEEVCNNDFEEGMISWFLGGKLNACENCVDRHAKEDGDKVALIWEADEPGEGKQVTYKELLREVSRLANVLRHHGIRKGDRVALYMPMIPEAVYAMLACARIGAVHSVVFAGFSAEALRDRINDAKCKAVITANEGLRGRRLIPLKRIVDEAVIACPTVQHIFVAKRTDSKVPFFEPRDVWLNEAMEAERPYCPIEHMDSEDTLFLLYTSGSTGKPKGLAHTTAGYLLYTALTHKYVFDYQPGDIFACVADIGWVTGHSYVVYGPLVNGATTVIFESVPNYPDSGRYWEMVERLKITQFYTAPTAIRAIQRDGDGFVKKYDRSSLRVLGTVGEPINPDTWKWYYEVVGESRCSIVDTWWQTETGGILISPLPAATPTKPGSATLPFFGIEPVLLTPEGEEVEGNDVSGLLAIKKPWPSMARTIQGDHQRFMETYLNSYKGYYLTGDGAMRDKDGYYWLTGRIDDVMNVSGHRIGSAEIEGALVSHPFCAEAAVVGFPHEIKGEGIFAYVLLKEGYTSNNELVGELRNEVRHHIGPIATPDQILIAPGLPKTRSGKIMRRILRKIAANQTEELGDISTLADPGVVDKLIELRGNL
ncbi:MULTISPECIES: acetate--CoA ligase [unclassified Saccharicrinis]|uniref:acetate--CoA ligase n=1 Tax=unclassified Saccharicrinis TaxID=2646859 RepID=UPI003D3356C6